MSVSKAPYRAEAVALIGALAALVAINLQLWGIETPPLIDWPNHLARHVLQCGAAGAENIGRYYVYDLEIVPNLASELIHTLPIACIDPDLTQKVLIQASSLGVVFATVVLHRAIWGVFSVWPVISGLIMHHMAWGYGFENFVLAVPVALLILAVWFFLAERSAAFRLLLVWPLAVGLYVLHLYAFGFLFLVVAALEVEQLWTRRGVARNGWRAVQTLSLLALIAAIPAVHMLSALQSSPEIETTLFGYGGLPTLLTTLVSPFTGYADPRQSRDALISALAVMFAFTLVILALRRAQIAVRFDPRVRRILPVLILATLIAPNNFSGVFLSNIRFPVLVLALGLAAARFEMPLRMVWAFAGAVLIVVAAKTTWIASQWRVHEAQVAELRRAAQVLSPDDRLLVVRQSRALSVILHTHSTSYVLRDRGAYWMGMFTGGNSLSPQPQYALRDDTQPFPFDWRILGPDFTDLPMFTEGGQLHEWPSFYTHALLLFDHQGARPEADPLGVVEASGSFFELYRIAPAPDEDWPRVADE